MQNANPVNSNPSEKQSDQKWTGKSQIERGISDLKDIKNLDMDDLKSAATNITGRVRDLSSDLMTDTVGFVKRYPVSSAVGLAAVGFLAGMVTARRK